MLNPIGSLVSGVFIIFVLGVGFVGGYHAKNNRFTSFFLDRVLLSENTRQVQADQKTFDFNPFN